MRGAGEHCEDEDDGEEDVNVREEPNENETGHAYRDKYCLKHVGAQNSV